MQLCIKKHYNFKRMNCTTFRLSTLIFIYTFRRMLFGSAPLLKIDGDIMIGGLVTLRDAGAINNLLCSSNISMFGIMRVEAMRYAIDKINKNQTLLYGLQLGIEIRDTCGTETVALDESLEFVNNKEITCSRKINKTFLGVVGDGMSVSTASAASLLSLFKIPLISYGATSIELSDQSKYSFLLRTVPDDSYQSNAMLDFIEKKLNWKSVYVLYSTGSYGESGFTSLLKASENFTLSIVDQKKIVPAASVNDIKKIIKDFFRFQPNITGILCYCEIPDTKNIVQAIEEENLASHYRLVGSDTFYQVKLNNTVSFSLYYNSSVKEDFYSNWYSYLTPHNFTSVDSYNITYSSMFMNFWKSACQVNIRRLNTNFNCSDYKNNLFKFCLDSTIEETCQRDDILPYTIDAVYAYAYAIRNFIEKDYSGNATKFNEELQHIDDHFTGKIFFNHLKNVSFNGSTGFVKFPVNARYGIYYNTHGILKPIGMWQSNTEERLNMFNENLYDFENTFSKSSSCQIQCHTSDGERKKFTSINNWCWKCEKCECNQFIENNECKSCEKGSVPSANREYCEELPLKDMPKEWYYIISTLSVTGFLFTVVTIITFLKNNSTPIVRASGREITYLILSIIMILYLLPFFLLVSLTPPMCKAFRFGVGVCFSILYISLFTKTNRIARIFSGRQVLLFVSPHWQLLLTFLFLSPQICISLYGYIRNKHVFVDNCSDRYKICNCYNDTNDFYITIAYNSVFIGVTTFYAFKTRKVPSNFNESRYIGFVVYISIAILLTFLPIFLSSSIEFKTISVMLDTIIVATTFLIGLYGVKMYIILFRPNKNKKARSVTFFYSKSESSIGTVMIEDNK
ncbi:metabotropic glutamate receptor isoform X2 [Hydra vulgaris]|uniref:Metabotropic glutamate receptor isoform X2 n=2 Tax=Hydra vulgaris TaxID=6087 RepID=A0ABM4BRI4_HYDVU